MLMTSRPQRTHLYRFIQLAIFFRLQELYTIGFLIVYTDHYFTKLLFYLQGRIQVRLRGGGEFQLVELMYILGENKI